MTGQFDWQRYFELPSDAASEDLRHAELLKDFFQKQKDPYQALEAVVANNMVPDRILSDLLADDNCPSSFWDRAYEGFLALKNSAKEQTLLEDRFLQLISHPNIPDAVLSNCCRQASFLEGEGISKASKILMEKSDWSLNSMLKAVFEKKYVKPEDVAALENILSDSQVSANVLKQSTGFLHKIKDRSAFKRVFDIITHHQNSNYDVAKALVYNSSMRSVHGEIFKKAINQYPFYEALKQDPADKGTLSGCIGLLAYAKDKEQMVALCQEILQNKGCTQDVVKTLLHKSSYSEYFADVSQLVQNSPLCTKSIKEKIAALEEQYPIRLEQRKQRKQVADYIAHPEKMPSTLSSADLESLRQEVLHYSNSDLHRESKNAIYLAIVKHPNCDVETICRIMNDSTTIKYHVTDEQNQDNPKFALAVKSFAALSEEKAKRETLTAQDYDENAMASFIAKAHEVVKSGDAQKIEEFRQSLFINGEADVYKLDHNAVDWFIKNGTTETLEALNSLRNLYGLNTVVERFEHADSDRTDAKRALFGGAISAVSPLLDKETGELNPHYQRKHSPAFFKFRMDMDNEYKPEDYDFSKNQAWIKMNEEGLHLPKEELAAYFADKHMPIEIFNDLNATDMIHFFLDSRDIDIQNGQTYKLKEFDPNAPEEGVREQYWKKIAADERIVDCISNDLWQKGFSEETIDQIWENCRNFGSPTRGENGVMNVFGLSLQIHHCRALKDNGMNADDNFVVVINIKKNKLNGNGEVFYNSHKPLHEYDNPCVFLYLDENGSITNTKTDCQIKVLTEPYAKQNDNERVAVYMGPDNKSCYTIDKKTGDVRTANYTAQATKKAQETPFSMKMLLAEVVNKGEEH